jgi:hypothetical protein
MQPTNVWPGRDPLVISVATDGFNFSRHWAVRSAFGSDKFGCRYCLSNSTGKFQYPAGMWRKSTQELLISYSINKEDIEMTRVPFSTLKTDEHATGGASGLVATPLMPTSADGTAAAAVPYYNDLLAETCWVDTTGQAFMQNDTRPHCDGPDDPNCPKGIPIPGKCPNPLANVPELPKPHFSWPLSWVPMANNKYPGNLSQNAMLVDYARITHSLPVDVNFVIAKCVPSETNTAAYIREVVKVCHQINRKKPKISCALALNYSPYRAMAGVASKFWIGVPPHTGGCQYVIP